MIVNGDWSAYAAALGSREGSSNILPLIEMIGENFVLDEFDEFGVKNVFYRFLESGIEFVFDTDVLNAVIFYVKSDGEYSACLCLSKLFDGLIDEVGISDVMKYFEGTSFCKGTHGKWIKFDMGELFIHFEFDEGHALSKVTLFSS
ncbi:hypothetical protein [Chromobacterium phragmitis]|uniref:hypothetical protein n=1 Tax=Chromobacterium phragmitis TaxID=2202141 RepID=UPI0011AE7D6A|nr:hypothetical protein [Chromobacterium phragmitis]